MALAFLEGPLKNLPAPEFLLDRDKSLPRLHKARIEAKATRLGMTLKPGFSLNPLQPNSKAVGPMKPFQGPTPSGNQRLLRQRHGGAGWRSFRAATFKRSRE